MSNKPNNISKEDLLQFQLLSAYVGLRNQDVDILTLQKENIEIKLEVATAAREGAVKELEAYKDLLFSKYKINPGDKVNYANGQIERQKEEKETKAESASTSPEE